jgi:hypothetical protein
MSQMGHSHPFAHAPITSGPPSSTDMESIGQQVSEVPQPDLGRLIKVARLAAASRAALYVVGAHCSAGLEGFERASVQAPFVLLGIRKHAHDNQSHYDKSSYDVLQHGCHSTG